jgi:hypothetical protein
MTSGTPGACSRPLCSGYPSGVSGGVLFLISRGLRLYGRLYLIFDVLMAAKKLHGSSGADGCECTFCCAFTESLAMNLKRAIKNGTSHNALPH